MFRPSIAVGLLFLAAGTGTSVAATAADTAPRSTWQQVSPDGAPGSTAAYDREAERQLLDKANTERAHAGLPALKMDEGLVRAARAHAAEMASQNQISHQFSGEPSLLQRLAANSSLHLNLAGENVAMAGTPDQAHEALM